MLEEVKVLDFGYVKLIESWGSDERIIETARMSTDKGFLGWDPEYVYECGHCHDSVTLREKLAEPAFCHNPRCNPPILIPTLKYNEKKSHPGDARLLKYLWDHKHSTPFEFAGMTIEIQAPIMVFREWHRHRTQAYSELSARYTPMPDLNYVPSVDRCFMVNGKNKQAGKLAGAGELTHGKAIEWLEALADVYEHAQRVYQMGLNYGIPKELARLPVPVGRYSRMRATANLRNWLGFLTLRLPDDAQFEIRQYSNIVCDLVAQQFSRTHGLFNADR